MYNRFQPSVEERGFDAINFISYLREQLSTKGLYFAIQIVEDSSMSKVFSVAKIVLFDITHGTDKYTLKLILICRP